MRNVNNGIYDRVIVNNDPDFTENSSSDISANYVILCEENPESETRPMYEYQICGLSLAEWVAMACDSKPAYITVLEKENFLNLIKPYINGTEYTVVLYANTPLVSKTHLKDLLEYVSIKRLNVCKLKKGFILKNDYIKEIDTIYSNLVYDLSSNDFFEVNTINDIDKVKDTLEKRMYNFHKKKGVFFYNQTSSTVDANVKIGADSKIAGGVSLLKNSVIGKNVQICENVVITNSKIEDNVIVEAGAIIENSIIKDNSHIDNGAIISRSVVGKSVEIGIGVKVMSSAIKDGAKVDNFSCLESASVSENASIGKACVLVGDGVTVVVDASSNLASGTNIVKGS